MLGIPKASLGNRVRLAVKGELSGAGGDDKVVKVSPEQVEIARLRAENARLRMGRDIAKSRGLHRAGRAARYAWIHQMRKLYPVSPMASSRPQTGSEYAYASFQQGPHDELTAIFYLTPLLFEGEPDL